MKLKGWTTPTPIGPFGLVVADGKVVAAGFTDVLEELHGYPSEADGVEMVSEIPGITDSVDSYFEGDLLAIDDIPVQPAGTERKLLAWAALRTTPPGPMTYKQLAERMAPPASARSAARACATNPVALIVPCHRFIGSDGKMHGFGWGVEKKVWLLDHEERFKK
ncbi:MAG: methylated-DNA-[protein]-cysteine S-methyltransferase [Actinomycetota bacterium]|jgi:methylated-DNA-[protein]-cysteine S-methyltransferase|nr:methylated-DNA-[protein]-cysteine S-methyltransferase [Actinomycetota bacterium]